MTATVLILGCVVFILVLFADSLWQRVGLLERRVQHLAGILNADDWQDWPR